VRRLGAILVVSLAFAACSDDDSTAPTAGPDASQTPGSGAGAATRDDVVATIVADVIVPGYERFDAASEALRTSIADLCAQPTDAGLAVAQEAWRETRQAWSATRAFRLGPATDRRAMSRIDFAIDPEKITDLLAGTDPVDVTAIGSLGSDQRGLGGIELALFTSAPVDPRSCDYAASASELVATTAASLADDWAAGVDMGTQVVIEDLVNGVVFALADVADMRLGPASGVTTGSAAPADVDAGPAQSALDDMLAVLDSVDAVVGGLEPLVSEQSAETTDRLATQLDNARTNIGLIPAPLATTTDEEAMASAYRSTTAALLLARTEVASLLGVTLTLGDADGDS
jgi:predicted lipoprotein